MDCTKEYKMLLEEGYEIDELSDDMKVISELLGIEAAYKLCNIFKGKQVYFPKSMLRNSDALTIQGMIDEEDIDNYREVYQEIIEHYGLEFAMKVNNKLNSMQFTFSFQILNKEALVKRTYRDFLNGIRYRQLAEKYECTERTIRNRIYKAKKELTGTK